MIFIHGLIWMTPDVSKLMKILEESIDLSQSCLSPKECKKFYNLLVDYADIFSLRDEIGLAPNMQVELEVLDKKPFFICPFSVKENMKPKIDKGMRKLEILDILKNSLSGYSSSAMPIPCNSTYCGRFQTS